MNTLAWPDEWYEVEPEYQTVLEQELSQEISSDHVLFGHSVRAISRRKDCDDVLFAVAGSSQVAEVHLVYRNRESHSDWPVAVLYQKLSEWQKGRAEAQHQCKPIRIGSKLAAGASAAQ